MSSGERARANTGRYPSGREPNSAAAIGWVLTANSSGNHAAPLATQRVSVAMCSSLNCFFGGMCGSLSGLRNWRRRLSLGLPSTNAGPSPPPLNAVCRCVRSRSPLVFFGLWQLTQWSRRRCIARLAKGTSSGPAAGALGQARHRPNRRANGLAKRRADFGVDRLTVCRD